MLPWMKFIHLHCMKIPQINYPFYCRWTFVNCGWTGVVSTLCSLRTVLLWMCLLAFTCLPIWRVSDGISLPSKVSFSLLLMRLSTVSRLLAIKISSSVKWLFKPFAHLSDFFLLICRRSLYILDASPSRLCVLQLSCPTQWFACSSFDDDVFCWAEVIDSITMYQSSMVSGCFVCLDHKVFPYPILGRRSPVLSSKHVIVLPFGLRSTVRPELVFVCGARQGFNFIFSYGSLIVLAQWHICHRSSIHICSPWSLDCESLS